ncbi:MAG: hypothetical protein OHK0017_08620 [Patescibacteria group bacterium]
MEPLEDEDELEDDELELDEANLPELELDEELEDEFPEAVEFSSSELVPELLFLKTVCCKINIPPKIATTKITIGIQFGFGDSL